MFKGIRKLLGLKSAVSSEANPQWDPGLFIYVKIPGDIQPLVRGERFEDPLQAELEQTGLGNISGGGSQLDDPDPDGSPRVEFCGIDVDVTDREKARAFLMKKLVELGAPDGTELHYTRDGTKLLDRYASGVWNEALSRTVTHPGFGV